MGGSKGRGDHGDERGPSATADLQEQLRREAEAHFRWAREARLRREARDRGEAAVRPPSEPAHAAPPEAAPAVQAEAVLPETVLPETVLPETVLPETVLPETEAPEAVEPPTVEPPAVVAFRASAGVAMQPALDAHWSELERGRRDLLAEWARLSRARERIDAAYERLDDLREQIERQRERLWMERFQLVSETHRPEPRPVEADRPWREAASHLVEAAVVVRAAVAQRAPQLLARLRGRGPRGIQSRGRRRELPPGS